MPMDRPPAQLALRHLAVRIATCPIVDICLHDDGLAHRCSRVVRQNNPTKDTPRAVPEPWYGHLGQAPILFISSNPGGGHPKALADPDDPETILSRAEDAFDGLAVEAMGSYWQAVYSLAGQLVGVTSSTFRPGLDYAITEVVHCGSAGEQEGDVAHAVHECAPRYTPMLLRLAAAHVIVLVGAIARDWFTNHLPLPHPINFGEAREQMVEGRRRLVLSIPHPSAHDGARKGLSEEQVEAVQAFLSHLKHQTPN